MTLTTALCQQFIKRPKKIYTCDTPLEMGIFKGFIATFFILSGTCYSTQGSTIRNCSRTDIKSKSGHINNDNFPSGVLSHTCKFWFYRGIPGEVLTVSFSTLDLPRSSDNDNCEENYLLIGPVPKVKICGNSSEPYIKWFDEIHNYLWIRFRTGSNPQGIGFFLYYIAGPQPASICSGDNYLCENGKCILGIWRCNGYDECGDSSDEKNCDPPLYDDRSSFRNLYLTSASNHTTPASSLPDADVDIPFQHPDTTLGYQWRHILTEQEGNFSMPPYPYLVSDIRNACWLIENNDPTSTINLEFQVFKLWTDQYIEVYDGPNENAPRVAWFNESVHTIVSSSNVLFVKFFAGYSRPPQRKVFVARYFVQDACEQGRLSCGPDDGKCFTQQQQCDGIWDCPVSGQDEKGCYGCPASLFSCYEFGESRGRCYTRQDRCSGSKVCDNYADERNCNKEQCSAEKNLFLCANKRCILDGWVCDGTDDCGDSSDEADCRLGSARKVIVAAVVGSLISSLLLVLALGCACKVYALRANEHPRSSRFDTPLSRLQAEMFRRRAPPPPYHEAMLTSRPYDEAVREFMAQNEVMRLMHEPAEGSSTRSQTLLPRDVDAGDAQDGGRDSEERAIQNLISLMDLSDDISSPSPSLSAPRLQILPADDSSDSEADEYGDHRNLAYEESIQIEFPHSSISHQGHFLASEDREGNHLAGECSSQDSASAILMDTFPENQPVVDKDKKDNGAVTAVSTGRQVPGTGDEDKETNESDADSVCILCLDSPSYNDDGSDTRCLLEDA